MSGEPSSFQVWSKVKKNSTWRNFFFQMCKKHIFQKRFCVKPSWKHLLNFFYFPCKSSDKRNETNYEEKKSFKETFSTLFYKVKMNYGKTFSHFHTGSKAKKKKKISWIFFLDGFHFWSIWNTLKNKIFSIFFHLASHSKTNHIFIDENWWKKVLPLSLCHSLRRENNLEQTSTNENGLLEKTILSSLRFYKIPVKCGSTK